MGLGKRLAFVLAVTIILALGVFIWKLDQVMSLHEKYQTQAHLAQELSAFSKTLELFSRQLHLALMHSYSEEKKALMANSLTYSLQAQSGAFKKSPLLGVAQLKANSVSQGLAWLSSQDGVFKLKDVEEALKSVPLPLLSDDSFSLRFAVLEFPNEKKYLGIIAGDKENFMLGLLNLSILSSLAASHRRGRSDFYVIDQFSHAVVHPNIDYLGASMKTHPLGQRLAESQLISEVFPMNTGEGQQALGGFERVDSTNLYVAFVTPLSGGLSFLPTVNWLEVAMALTLVFVLGLGLGWWMLVPIKDTLKYYRDSIFNLAASQPLPTEVQGAGTAEVHQLFKNLQTQLLEISESHKPLAKKESLSATKVIGVSSSERQLLFKNFSGHLANLFGGPINALLGHLQLVKARPDETIFSDSLKSLEGEARKIKMILQDLKDLSQVDDSVWKPVLLNDVVSDVIREKTPQLKSRGIKVHQKLFSKKYIRANVVLLERALSHIIDFFIDSFTEQVQRDLFFTLSEDENEIFLQFETNSEQLSVERLKDLLEPYSRNFEQQADTLTLAVARGLIAQMQGVIEVREASAQGVSLQTFWPFMKVDEVDKYMSEQALPESQLDEPAHDEVASIVDPVPEVEEYKVVIDHNHSDSSTEENEEEDVDSFVMVRPPKATDVPPQFREAVEPFETKTVTSLGGQSPLPGGAALPLSNLKPIKNELRVEIRRPKVRTDI